MKKFLIALCLIFFAQSVRAESVEEFYNMLNKNQSLTAIYTNGLFYGVLFEKYKTPELVQEKFKSCQKKLSTIEMLIGFKLLYTKDKLDKSADANGVLYQMFKENCLENK